MGDQQNQPKKDDIAQKDAIIADYTDHLKRLQAEFENYVKRVEKERVELMNRASERLIVKLLLVVDDFERALKELANVPEQTRNGIEMIFKNLHKILDEERVEAINAVGQKADPYKHEVIMHADADAPEGIVLEEFQKGYTLNGKVIRYSKVKVSTGKNNKT